MHRRTFLAGLGCSALRLVLGPDVSQWLLMASGGTGGGGRGVGPLRKYHQALANRASSPVDIVCIGDSITEGYWASSLANRWPEQILAALDGIYGSGGNVSIYRPTTWGDPGTPPLTLPWTVVSPLALDDWGLGRRYVVLGSTHATSMSISETCTGFSIVYTSGPSGSSFGSFYYAVDGGSTVSVSAVNASVLAGRLHTVTGLSLASHSVVITPHTDNVPIEGIIFYNGNETNGIRVWEGGHSGAVTSYYTDPAFPHWIDLLTNIEPDLAIIMLGRNEWVASTSVATFIANLSTLIAHVRASCSPAPSILVVAEMIGDYTPGLPWSDYVDAMAALFPGVVYIDLNPAFGGYTVPPSGSLYNADLKHPSGAGETEIATEVMALIG